MNITTRKIGRSIIEMTIEVGNTTIVDTVTKLDGTIEDGLISNLEDILYELRKHNEEHVY
jgi:hypothetical protein